MGNAPAVAFAFLLFASIANADFVSANLGSKQHIEDWSAMAASAVLACMFFNLLIYMAGFAFESEHLKKYAKSEFLQVTASSLMIFFAVELIYTMSGSGLAFMQDTIGAGSSVSCAAATGGRYYVFNNQEFGGGPLGAFKCKVQEKITALDRAYRNIYQSNKGTEVWTSVCFSLFGAPVWCGDWSQDRHNEVEEAHYVATKIVSLLMPLHAQYVLAQYLQNNMLSVFLPLGLVLRIFPFTRGVGGLFIALAIGFFFIFPTFVILSDPTYVRADEAMAERLAGMCFTGFKGAATLISNVLSAGAGAGGTFASAQGAELVYQISIASVFYPFVSLVLTLVFVRAMTPLLGGDMGELMKMVSRLG